MAVRATSAHALWGEFFDGVSAVCRRWRVEEDFQQAKGLAHLDTGQVTCWTSWHRWSLMSMLAHTLLAVGALHERQRDRAELADELAMVPVSPRELLALFRVFALPRPHQDTDPAHALRWSHWRRTDTSIEQPTATAAGTT